jgi:hypothetical protein
MSLINSFVFVAHMRWYNRLHVHIGCVNRKKGHQDAQ